MSKGNLIIGAGGHGKVVADALVSAGMPLIGFVDDDPEIIGQRILRFPVLGKIDQWLEYDFEGTVIAIGNNYIRRSIQERMEIRGRPNWITVTHPKAIVSNTVKIGTGTVILAGAIVNPDSVIGQHTIINTGATVDHDCVIGDFVHIAPGVHLAGGVQIDDNTLIGIGSAIIPGIHVGNDTTVGAGAVITKDVPARVTAKGIPARW